MRDHFHIWKHTCRFFPVFMALTITPNLRPQEIVILRNQRFEFSQFERFTAESASKAYADTLTHLGVLSRDPLLEERSCTFGREAHLRCIGYYFLAPFPVVLPYQIADGEILETVYTWAPVRDAFGGERAIRDWIQSAKIERKFGCYRSSCLAIVRMSETSDFARSDGLAVCEVLDAAGMLFLPKRCTPIAITVAEQTWIKVVAGFQPSTRAQAKAVPGPNMLSIQITGEQPPTISDVLSAAQNALSKSPMKLTTRILFNAVFGSEAYRVSPVLTGWREIVDVRIDTTETIQGKSRIIYATVFVTLYVNRQNTDRPEDWHMPTLQQLHQYTNALRDSLHAPFESLCKSSRWQDSATLSCSP